MFIVEKQPNEDPSISIFNGGPAELEAYFKGEAEVFRCSIDGKDYRLVCHQEGLQAKKDEIKAIYGPLLVCGEDLDSLSKQEAEKVQQYLYDDRFELKSIKLVCS